MARKTLSPRRRFAILKRDGFACQYCGRKAPEVELHVDHIEPLDLGGADTDDNLIAACASCNLSKSTGRLFLVRRCHYCREDGAPGLFFDINYEEEGGRFVCNECLEWIVCRYDLMANVQKWHCQFCQRDGDSLPRMYGHGEDAFDVTVHIMCDPCRVDARARREARKRGEDL